MTKSNSNEHPFATFWVWSAGAPIKGLAHRYRTRSLDKIALSLVILTELVFGAAASWASDSGAAGGTFKGLVAPARSYEFAPSSDGKLVKIHFVPAQWVEKGALLFTMDSTKEELELERDQAVLLRAEAQLRAAEAGFKNNAVLRDKNVTSERQYHEAELQRDMAAAAAAEARVQVKGDQLKIAGLKLYAPFSGVMSPPPIAEGAYVTQQSCKQTSLATITALDPIQVKAWIPYDVYVDQLRILDLGGDHVEPERALSRIEVFLTLPNGQRYSLAGRFSGGGYDFDPQTQVMEVMTEFPNPHLLLRPGLAVTLQGRIRPN